jgi:hypothetical protein
MKTGIELIAEERQRQISVEGWTPEHDNKHENGEMAGAAAAYALESTGRNFDEQIAVVWPWDDEWWKPGDRIRDLVKAGALIAAEIDRLQRVSK